MTPSLGWAPQAAPQRVSGPAGESSLKKPALILGALVLLLSWAPRLHWGLWTDEAGTYWMACHGWKAAIGRTTNWAGQSILYSVLESFFIGRGGWLEPLLRLPSVVAALLAAWQIKKLAELTVDPDAGWLAVVAFLCMPDTASFATSARPYALALAASLASFRYLVEWQKFPRMSLAIRYLAVSILTLYLHYLFGFIFLVQALYLGFCWWRGRRGPLWLPAAAAVVLPASLLPLVRALRATASQTGDFANAAKPQFLQLLQWYFPPVLLLAAALGGLLLMLSVRNVRWRPARLEAESVFLLSFWLLLAPAAFFLVSRFTDISVFAARYMLFTVPATVLILTWLMCGLPRPPWRMTVLLAVFAATVLHPGALLYVFHPASNSWREPLQSIARQSRQDRAPVFVTSGIADSNGLDWQHMDPRTGWLYAALTTYPIPNRLLPLPYRFSEDAQKFVRSTMQKDLRGIDHLFLLAASDSPIGDWMSSYLNKQGFSNNETEWGDFAVIEYRRPAKE
jgi:hypothetical protein